MEPGSPAEGPAGRADGLPPPAGRCFGSPAELGAALSAAVEAHAHCRLVPYLLLPGGSWAYLERPDSRPRAVVEVLRPRPAAPLKHARLDWRDEPRPVIAVDAVYFSPRGRIERRFELPDERGRTPKAAAEQMARNAALQAAGPADRCEYRWRREFVAQPGEWVRRDAEPAWGDWVAAAHARGMRAARVMRGLDSYGFPPEGPRPDQVGVEVRVLDWLPAGRVPGRVRCRCVWPDAENPRAWQGPDDGFEKRKWFLLYELDADRGPTGAEHAVHGGLAVPLAIPDSVPGTPQTAVTPSTPAPGTPVVSPITPGWTVAVVAGRAETEEEEEAAEAERTSAVPAAGKDDPAPDAPSPLPELPSSPSKDTTPLPTPSPVPPTPSPLPPNPTLPRSPLRSPASNPASPPARIRSSTSPSSTPLRSPASNPASPASPRIHSPASPSSLPGSPSRRQGAPLNPSPSPAAQSHVRSASVVGRSTSADRSHAHARRLSAAYPSPSPAPPPIPITRAASGRHALPELRVDTGRSPILLSAVHPEAQGGGTPGTGGKTPTPKTGVGSPRGTTPGTGAAGLPGLPGETSEG